MARRRTSPRALRRERDRLEARLARDRERLARLEPGGGPERPIAVESPAQVEVIAGARGCPLCRGGLRVEAHAAETVDGRRLRVAHTRCGGCGTRRALYFRLAGPALH